GSSVIDYHKLFISFFKEPDIFIIQNQIIFFIAVVCIENLYDLVISQPNRARQQEALAFAISDILWKAGERQSATVAIYSPDSPSCCKDAPSYIKDGFTEKMLLYEFSKYDQLLQFLRRYYFFGQTQMGIPLRADIGFLYYKQGEEDNALEIGSRLKTPFHPIWVTYCNDSFGVLFSTTKDLVRDYHAERHFELQYYNLSAGQLNPALLDVDCRQHTFILRDPRTQEITPLESLIQTKWPDARVSWNGLSPFL
ncbi:unnamed protein product, partial [Cyprideis torosa]